MADRILLADGTSLFLLADGTSKLLLAGATPAGVVTGTATGGATTAGAAVATNATAAGITLKIQVGFGSTWQTEPAAITWTDVTNQVMDRRQPVTTSRGASSAFGEPDTGQADLTLRNSDRRFDPLHTAGPYYGNLKPGVPIKIEGRLITGVVKPLWRGTVARWPQRYDRGNRYATVPITAYDGFDKLSRAKIPRSVMETAIMPLNPVGYWPLDDPANSLTASDTTSSNTGMAWDEPAFGADPLGPGLGTSTEFDGVNDRIDISRGPLIAFPLVSTVVAVVATDIPAETLTAHTIFAQVNGNPFAPTGLQMLVDSAGAVRIGATVNGTGGSYSTGQSIADGDPHLLFGEVGFTPADNGISVDTATLSTAFPIVVVSPGGNGTAIAGPSLTGKNYSLNHFPGRIGHVAIWNRQLTLTERQAIVTGYGGLDGQTTSQRITYILDQIGWPTTLRSIETGRSFLGPATFKPGDKALQYMQSVTDTEDGHLFVTADGKIRFTDRYFPYVQSVAVTSQAIFSDLGVGGYAEFDLDLDDELLVNVARFTRRDGAEQVATNDASVEAYGEAELQKSDLLHRTDIETRSLAEWTVTTRSTPLPRVPKIRVGLHTYSSAVQSAVLSLDLGHLVTCVRTPQAVGSAIVANFLVEGIKHEVTAKEWWVELYVSPAPQGTATLFKLGTSTLGGVDILAH